MSDIVPNPDDSSKAQGNALFDANHVGGSAEGVIVDEFGKPFTKSGNALNQQRSTVRDLSRRLRKSGNLNFWLTAIIAASTVAQTVNSCNNNAITAQQTDQLISASRYGAYAANINGQAARDFASSAAQINRGVGDAVTKLQMQANATEEARESSEENSRTALQATIDNFRQEQRPWLGIAIFPDKNSGLPSVTIQVHNTGKTPANSFGFLCCKVEQSPFPGESFPSYDSIDVQDKADTIREREKRFKTYYGRDPDSQKWMMMSLKEHERADQEFDSKLAGDEVIPPDGYHPETLAVSRGGRMVNYYIGKIVYRDVYDRSALHKTDFCLTQLADQPLSFCRTGQHME